MHQQIPSAISRRQFLSRSAVGTLSAGVLATSLVAADSSSKTLRVIAYNVYECTGWPKDRVLGKKATSLGQMPERFAFELALYNPDIVQFSESPSEAVAQEIAEQLQMNFVRFPSGGKWPGTLFSKYEIVDVLNAPAAAESRDKKLFTRHWGQATVKLPSGDLILHSAHMHPGPEPETRQREVPVMLAAMKRDLDAGKSMLLIGDLNHTPDDPEYKQWLAAGWSDTFAKVGAGKGVTFMADKFDRRIDYILAAGPIAKQVTEARPIFEGAFRINEDDPESFALSDHLPQLAVFKLD